MTWEHRKRNHGLYKQVRQQASLVLKSLFVSGVGHPPVKLYKCDRGPWKQELTHTHNAVFGVLWEELQALG